MTPEDKPPRRRALHDEERALWNGVTRSVVPLRRRRAPPVLPAVEAGEKKRKPAPAPRAATVPAARAPAPKAPPPMQFDRRLKQRLARGTEAVDARIDLHGKTQSQAHAALLRFLHRAQADGARTILVITGKGARTGARASKDTDDFAGEHGVLKRQVPLWLGLPDFRAYVIGFEDAHVGHGGEGALYVRLRRGA